jgi:peptidoglycan/LPS O-acetylase OafA/YrhL
MVFVYAMLVMSVSGAVMAALKPERVSVIAGLLTFYLVVTGLLTVRRHGQGFNWMDTGAMLFGLAVGITGFIFGVGGFSREIDGPPPAIAIVFGAVALLAAFGDVRMLLARGVPWSQRIARHLWRMCLALWIAAASFFLGQADEFPESLRIMPLLCSPVLLVMLLMFYWLVRVLFTQWRPRA